MIRLITHHHQSQKTPLRLKSAPTAVNHLHAPPVDVDTQHAIVNAVTEEKNPVKKTNSKEKQAAVTEKKDHANHREKAYHNPSLINQIPTSFVRFARYWE